MAAKKVTESTVAELVVTNNWWSRWRQKLGWLGFFLKSLSCWACLG
ncbi:hypothetical protein ES332_A10G224300v1 [Gossypium tomentosum]|uniref:Uncharacterized protein n=1 Tax=Gossypium tomentosum TaxID=34277 RepID=A0A5D2NTE3_GOSTO|nr:hypothetical protein ES332_A10G224300v1 [Gossypium tomentosum]